MVLFCPKETDEEASKAEGILSGTKSQADSESLLSMDSSDAVRCCDSRRLYSFSLALVGAALMANHPATEAGGYYWRMSEVNAFKECHKFLPGGVELKPEFKLKEKRKKEARLGTESRYGKKEILRKDFSFNPVITLTPAQKEIDADGSRFKLIEAGRRFGKSKYAAYWQIREADKRRGADHYYVARTYSQAKDIAWFEFLEQIPREMIRRKNERELTIELICDKKTRICLKGSDKEDNLRGRKLGSLVMEEAAFQKPHIYSKIFRPMLADMEAPALFISSPKKSWFTKLRNDIRDGVIRNAKAFHYTIYDNPHIKRDEIEEIRATESEDVWRQEYMAEELEYSGLVYGEFSTSSIFQPSERFEDHLKWPCVLAVDWGVHDPTAIVWLHVSPQGYVVVSREHLRAGWDTKRHAEVLQVQSRGRAIDVGNYVMDRSAFRNEGTSMTSIADQFRQHMGFSFQRSEKDVNAGHDMMKRFWRGDGDKPWLYISTSCPEAIKAVQSYEHGDHEPDVLAAIRYGLVHLVKRGLSKIGDGATKFNFEGEMNEDRLKILTGLKPPPSFLKRERWGWDGEFGQPEIGAWA